MILAAGLFALGAKEAARDQDTEPRQSGPEHLTGEDPDQAANHHVGKQMGWVSVQAQGGHGPPPLTLSDRTRVCLAGGEPIKTEHVEVLQKEMAKLPPSASAEVEFDLDESPFL